MELCAQAAVEQDPDRLLILVHEINRLLEEKERRLKQRGSPSGPAADPPKHDPATDDPTEHDPLKHDPPEQT